MLEAGLQSVFVAIGRVLEIGLVDRGDIAELWGLYVACSDPLPLA